MLVCSTIHQKFPFAIFAAMKMNAKVHVKHPALKLLLNFGIAYVFNLVV